MNHNCNKYIAFGLIIESEFSIVQITNAEESKKADVKIRSRDLSNIISDEEFECKDNITCIGIPEVGKFRISNGNSIEVDRNPSCPDTLLSVYLMGSCMGAVLYQRDSFLIHGSCVSDGTDTILISGDTGAGKSTTASEFLSHGWKLMSDDVSLIYHTDEGMPCVQSSYPSQKLWQDSLMNSGYEIERVHSLYSEEDRVKYGVSVLDKFYEGTMPLTHIIRLLPNDVETGIYPVGGMAKVDQLVRNTYRYYMIPEKDRQRHFQRCVNLAQKVPMSLVVRNRNEQTAHQLYEMIVNTVKNKEN